MNRGKTCVLFLVGISHWVFVDAWQQPAISFDHAKRYSSYPYISADTFRAICNHHIDEAHRTFNPADVKDGDLIFVRGYVSFMNQFVRLLPSIKKKFILITHSTDDTWPGQYGHLLDDPRVIAWFTANKDYHHSSKLIGLPIGLANPYWPHGDTRIITDAIERMRNAPKKYFLYINYSSGTNPRDRDAAFNYFKDEPFAYIAGRKPWGEYLDDLASSKFVLSPPGHGMDCHRAWEALLMGSIPVMLSTSIDFLFDDLPVVIVKNWNEVTQDFLEKKYDEIQGKTYNLQKLYADYWLNKINIVKAYMKKGR